MTQSPAPASAQKRIAFRPRRFRPLRLVAVAAAVLMAGAWLQIAGLRLPDTIAADTPDATGGRSVFGLAVLVAGIFGFLALLGAAFHQPDSGQCGRSGQAGHALQASDATDRLSPQGLRRAALMLVGVAAVAAIALSFNGPA